MNRKNNIVKILILIGAITLASFFAFSYYENFNNSSNLNKFLEEASTVSLVHSESAKEFEKVLNFDEIKSVKLDISEEDLELLKRSINFFDFWTVLKRVVVDGRFF